MDAPAVDHRLETAGCTVGPDVPAAAETVVPDPPFAGKGGSRHQSDRQADGCLRAVAIMNGPASSGETFQVPKRLMRKSCTRLTLSS